MRVRPADAVYALAVATDTVRAIGVDAVEGGAAVDDVSAAAADVDDVSAVERVDAIGSQIAVDAIGPCGSEPAVRRERVDAESPEVAVQSEPPNAPASPRSAGRRRTAGSCP